MADIRPKDLPAVTAFTAGDKFLIDGATTRSMAYDAALAALGIGVNVYNTIADLEAATILAPVIKVSTLGYFAAGDGGGATYIRNSSAPVYITSADGAKWQNADRGIFNIKQYGAVGGTTDDSTVVQAVINEAADTLLNVGKRPVIFIPAGLWKFSVSVQDKYGFIIRGQGIKSARVVSASSTAPVFDVFSNVGSGSVADFVIEDIEISGPDYPTGSTLRIWNALHFSVRNCLISGALTIQGSGNFVLDNVEVYGTTSIGNGNGTLTNAGPGIVLAGQFQGGNGNEALLLQGDLLGISFHGIMYSCIGGVVSVRIDGPTSGTPVGSVDFFGCHAESNYFDATQVGIDFQIGENHKFGHVGIYGGNYWGKGDGTFYRSNWVNIIRARNVVIEGVTLSNLGATGYAVAGISLASTFPGAGDTYSFRNNTMDISGARYSDANGHLTGGTGDATNIGRVVSNFLFAGQASGSTLLQATSVASGTLLLPAIGAATDTLAGLAATQTFTNKTYDTAGAGNSFKINGVAATDNTGTGKVVRDTSPTLVTPALGAATATSINGANIDNLAWTAYTPTVTSGTGTITTATATGAYKVIGKTVHFRAKATITTNGTGGGRVEVTLPPSLPVSDTTPFSAVNGTSGVVLSASAITSISNSKVLIFNSTGAYPGADGWVGGVGGVYETP